MTVERLIELLRKANPDGTASVTIYEPHDDYFLSIVDMDMSGNGKSVHLHIGDLMFEME